MTQSSESAEWPEPRRIVGQVDGRLDGDHNEPVDGKAADAGLENQAMRDKYPFLKLGDKSRTALSSEEAVRGLRRVMGEDGEVHGQGSTG
jgi:hypothetical protein